MKIKTCASILAVIFLTSCGKADKENEPSIQDISPAAPAPFSFSGMPPREVLQYQYKKAVLSCELRTQKGAKLDLKAPPQDSLQWDLLQDSVMPENFSLRGAAEKNHSFTIFLTLRALTIVNTQPVIDLTYHYRNKIIDSHEITTTDMGDGPSKLDENIEDNVFASEYKTGDRGSSYFVDFRCLLKTEHKN